MLQESKNVPDPQGRDGRDPGRRLLARRQQRGHGERRRPGEHLRTGAGRPGPVVAGSCRRGRGACLFARRTDAGQRRLRQSRSNSGIAATGEQIRSLAGHTGWVVSLAFSHDGQTLASGSYDRSIRLWNVADGLERATCWPATRRRFARWPFRTTTSCWPAAAPTIPCGCGTRPAARRKPRWPATKAECGASRFRPTIGCWLRAAKIRRSNFGTSIRTQLVGTLTGHTDMVSAVAFAQETLVSTSWDRTVRTWDAEAHEMRGNLAAGVPVVALAVAPDGHRLLTAGANQSLALWKATARRGPADGGAGRIPRVSLDVPLFRPTETAWPWPPAGLTEETDLYLYDLAERRPRNIMSPFPAASAASPLLRPAICWPWAFRASSCCWSMPPTVSEVASLEEQRDRSQSAAGQRRAVGRGGVLARRQTAGRCLARPRRADLRRRAPRARQNADRPQRRRVVDRVLARSSRS